MPTGQIEKVHAAIQTMIRSASGWRGVFASSADGEGREPDISPEHTFIIAAAAKVFAAYLTQHYGGPRTIIVGMDTRPTGPAIATALMGAFAAMGFEVCFVGVAAAPEIMAYARSCGLIEGGRTGGFVYVSASHNPIGHNGLKFGLVDGAVLSGAQALTLIAAFTELVSNVKLLPTVDEKALDAVYAACEHAKAQCLAAYFAFANETISGHAELHKQRAVLEALSAAVHDAPLSIVADFNGSARTCSIDEAFFKSLAIPLYAINAKPGEIVHRIVPEGDALEAALCFLEAVHQMDPSAVLGYVPDCDGDRGNLVIWDEQQHKARALDGQEVFALACLSELAYLVWRGELRADNCAAFALAVNDPTSLRVDRIAQAFGVRVFRAEVGEANVVGIARQLREQGYTVPILGEGPAGGTITYPAEVRDPLNTVFALVKLLCLRSMDGAKGLFELWCASSGQQSKYRVDFSLSDVIATLPAFVTTESYSKQAVLRIKTADHALLKKRYQAIFLREWDLRHVELTARFGYTRWEAVGYQGLTETRHLDDFSSTGKGGLKISLFTNTAQESSAWIWMRGSATEPVFRIMADAESTEEEQYLVLWQRDLVLEADEA
ncbi:phosphatidylglycerol lysyltransferase [Breznakiellaceae bacterium SP9]